MTSTPPDRASEIALVTGASSGLGLLTAIELARAGFRVMATMRDLARRGAVEDAARRAGVAVYVCELDVTDPGSIERAVAAARSIGPRFSVLVNNAGFTMDGFFEDLSDEDLQLQFDTNVFGLAAVTRAFLPAMREHRAGRVINISSISGRFAGPGYAAYCASKWAVEGLSEALRFELLPFGIHVVLIEPSGFYGTDILTRNRRLATRALDPASPYFAATQRMNAQTAAMSTQMFGDPAQVARAIVEAATSPRPALRRRIGRQALWKALRRRLLPARWNERREIRAVFGDTALADDKSQ
ncbi:MAG TPA: SDR family NAD(P)-dependent oxidoreductase [Kofleriaceae bacterium]|nr:SDR family NAD(P)-dependent oxidoreductase [Kofleriaceae bacterium]